MGWIRSRGFRQISKHLKHKPERTRSICWGLASQKRGLRGIISRKCRKFNPNLKVGENSAVETTYRLQVDNMHWAPPVSLIQPFSLPCFSSLGFSHISARALHSSCIWCPAIPDPWLLWSQTASYTKMCDGFMMSKKKSHIGHISLPNKDHRLWPQISGAEGAVSASRKANP